MLEKTEEKLETERPNRKEMTAQKLAKLFVSVCFRNTFLEDLHAGFGPFSKTGDYSDVKVVTPDREIPWSNLSRISDEEMKKLMKECVDKMYTMLVRIFEEGDEDFLRLCVEQNKKALYEWDEPKITERF